MAVGDEVVRGGRAASSTGREDDIGTFVESVRVITGVRGLPWLREFHLFSGLTILVPMGSRSLVPSMLIAYHWMSDSHSGGC